MTRQSIMLAVALATVGVQAQEPTRVILSDGTVVELFGVPDGAKVTGRVVRHATPTPSEATGRDSGYQRLITDYLKEKTNDPDRLQIVSIDKPLPLRSVFLWEGHEGDDDFRPLDTPLWATPDIEGVAVLAIFRATNGLGALVLAKRYFLIDTDGQIDRVIKSEDLRTTRPALKNDVFVDEFLRSADSVKRSLGIPVDEKEPTIRLNPDDKPDAAEKYRYWTFGRSRISARLIKYEDGQVILRAKNGVDTAVFASQLSDRDQRYLERKALP